MSGSRSVTSHVQPYGRRQQEGHAALKKFVGSMLLTWCAVEDGCAGMQMDLRLLRAVLECARICCFLLYIEKEFENVEAGGDAKDNCRQ